MSKNKEVFSRVTHVIYTSFCMVAPPYTGEIKITPPQLKDPPSKFWQIWKKIKTPHTFSGNRFWKKIKPPLRPPKYWQILDAGINFGTPIYTVYQGEIEQKNARRRRAGKFWGYTKAKLNKKCAPKARRKIFGGIPRQKRSKPTFL